MTEAGWYSSKAAPGFERYWDGAKWTEQYRESSAILSNESVPTPQSHFPAPEAGSPWLSNQPVQELPPPGPRLNTYTPNYVNGPYTVAPVEQKDTLGIVAFVLAFLVPVAGVVVGHVAYARKRPDGSRSGMALAALIVGWVFTLFSLFIWVLFFIGFAQTNQYYDDYETSELYYVEWTAADILEEQNFFGDGYWDVVCDFGDDTEFMVGSKYSCDANWADFENYENDTTFQIEVEILGGDDYDPELLITYLDGDRVERELTNATPSDALVS